MRPFPADLEAALARSGENLSIAVIRLGAMGDIVRVLPAVRLLRFHLPDALIHWICDDRWAVLLHGHRDLDSILAVPRTRWRLDLRNPALWPSLAADGIRFRRRLRSLGCGLAVDFHGNLRSGLVALWTGAAVRVGHASHQQKEGNRLFTTHRVDPGYERRRSRIDRHLSLLHPLGVPDEILPDAGFKPNPTEWEDARETLRAAGVDPGRPYAVLNPGASKTQSHKRPPAALLAAAGVESQRLGVAPVVIHGPGEADDARAVAAASGGAARVAPPTSLRVLVPLLRGARLFVGGDSGPLHLACGVGCPVVGLYGSTDPVVNAPWNVPYRIVQPPGRTYTGVKRVDRASGGFDGLTPSEVTRAVVELLEESAANG